MLRVTQQRREGQTQDWFEPLLSDSEGRRSKEERVLEQLGRLRGPKLGCSASWSKGAAERLPLGLLVGAPADADGGAPGARHSVPRAQLWRCFPAWLQPPQTIQLQSLLALTAQ